ncbi:hypothetical protein LEN26_013933, partial [Aphanomyces euteiches]
MDVNFVRRLLRWARRRKIRWNVIIDLFEYSLGLSAERSLIPDIRFKLDMRDIDAEKSFRFKVNGVLQLTSLVGVPNVIITETRDRVVGVEAMCIVLRRLRYPTTYYDMVAVFGRSREQLCRVFNFMVDFIYGRWKQTIYCPTRLVQSRIATYAKEIYNKGAPLRTVWAFPD